MVAESRFSVWARRGTILVAALASIATSQAAWQIEAKLPAGAAAGATGTRVVVESSHAPSVTGKRGSDGTQIQPAPEERGPWTGTGTYYLPPGFALQAAAIQGHDCSSGGGMCSPCQPPARAFVRVTAEEPVAPWSVTATGPEQIAHVDATHPSVAFLVEADATRRFELEAEATGGDRKLVKAMVWRTDAPADGGMAQRFNVTWYATDAHPTAPAEVRWIPRATLYGYCTAPGECRAPAGAAVKIVSVTPL